MCNLLGNKSYGSASASHLLIASSNNCFAFPASPVRTPELRYSIGLPAMTIGGQLTSIPLNSSERVASVFPACGRWVDKRLFHYARGADRTGRSKHDRQSIP